MRYHLPIFFLILSSIILVRSGTADAQFRNQRKVPLQASVRTDSLRVDSISRKGRTSLNVRDIAWQFLGGEIAFNVTSFALWGNDFYTISRSNNELGVIGIVASLVTVPLAIDFTSAQLGLKNGSLGTSVAGAVGGLFLVGLPMLAIFQPPTYLKFYLFLSLPIITFAQLVYDLTISDSE